jgi:hypothetical protein
MVRLELDPDLLAVLVALGWLSSDQQEDRAEVGAAFATFVRAAAGFARRNPRTGPLLLHAPAAGAVASDG